MSQKLRGTLTYVIKVLLTFLVVVLSCRGGHRKSRGVLSGEYKGRGFMMTMMIIFFSQTLAVKRALHYGLNSLF